MRARSISPIIASFMALRVSGRLRVSVTMLSCRWYRTDPFVIRELLGTAPSVRVHDRAQHDPTLVRPVVAGAAVHRRALVPDQDIADAPAVVVDEALLGRVSGELIDQRPRLLPLHADEAMRVHGIDEQDRPSGHRMPCDRGPLHFLILLVGHAFVVPIEPLAGGPPSPATHASGTAQQPVAVLRRR